MKSGTLVRGLGIKRIGEYLSIEVGRRNAFNKNHKYHIGEEMDAFKSICGREDNLESIGDSEYPFKVDTKRICKLCLRKDRKNDENKK